ncbi:MAG: phage baseplate assembly protein V [Myxococcales bacterium]|nr:phage baseplate assembly protein V [Myxococcales bacterium]
MSLINRLRNRIANSIARAVVQVIDDEKKIQTLQLGVLEGEDVDDCERFQEYGFNSVPIAGAEAVVLFPNGDRAHPLIVAVDDRRHRPTDWDPGDAGTYNAAGAMVRLKASGDIEVTPGGSGKVYIRSAGGTSDALVTKTEHNLHIHGTGVGPSATPTTQVVGTTKLESE